MDFAILTALNGIAGHAPWIDWVIVFCAEQLQYVLAALLVVYALWPRRNIRSATIAVLAAGIARFALKPIILIWVHRARPYVALADVRNIIGPQLGEELQSMPSGHALFFFALAAALWRTNRRWGMVFGAGALVMGLARIAGGIHWPSDVLVGAVLGSLIGWFLARFSASHA